MKQTNQETPDLRIIRMSDIQPVPIHWLWEPFIPYGAISLIQGDGAAGKTSSSLAIAAAVTRGNLLPGHTGIAEPGFVILQNAEDSYPQVLRPKLELYGADCDLVHVIDEDEYPLSLGDERIEQTIIETGAKLLILDPVQAYLGGANMNSANGIRPLMRYLGEVASRHNCAVLLVGHLHKTGGKAAYRGLGSIDIYAAARSVMTIGEVADENMRVIVNNKNNLAPAGASASFRFEPDGSFNWTGESDLTINEVLSGKRNDDKPSQLDIAMDFISSAMETGITSAAEIKALAASAGISKNTLDRAKTALGVRSVKQGDSWQWVMPGNEVPQDTQEPHENMNGDVETVEAEEILDTVDTLPAGNGDMAEDTQITDDGDVGVLDIDNAANPIDSNASQEEPQDTQIVSVGVLAPTPSGASGMTGAPNHNQTGKKRKRRRRRRYNNRTAGNNTPAATGKAG